MRSLVPPEDIYEYIASTIKGNDVKKIYNECLKHYGLRMRCKCKAFANIKDIKKIIDRKTPVIYNDAIVITGYKEYGEVTKIRIEDSESYIEYTKGNIFWV